MTENKIKQSPDWLLIDAPNLCSRAWHAMEGLTAPDGRPSDLEHGLLSMVAGLLHRYPRSIPVFLWDGLPRRATDLYPDYKANRDRSERQEKNVYGRQDLLRAVLGHLFPFGYHPEQEADDLAGRLCRQLEGSIGLLSSDDDWRGLIDDTEGVFVLRPRVSGTGEDYIDEAAHLDRATNKNKAPVLPVRWALFRAFDGDTSDNLPGLSRVRRSAIAEAVNAVDLSAPDTDKVNQATDYGAGKATATMRPRWEHHRPQALVNYQIMNLRDLDGVTALQSSGDDRDLLEALCLDLGLNRVREEMLPVFLQAAERVSATLATLPLQLETPTTTAAVASS